VTAGRISRVLFGSVLLIASLAFSLVIAEIILQRFSAAKYFVLPPGLMQVFHPVPDTMPGVSGPSVYSVSSVGTRGTEWSDDHRFRILAIGGSTTECLYLDDSEAWPYLLEQRINAKFGAGTAWVGNVGRSGHNTRNHILQAEKLLGQLPDIDVLILMIGINDFALRLLHESDFVTLSEESRKYRQKLFYRSFALIPPMEPELPFFQRLAIWQQARKFKKVVLDSESDENMQDDTGEIYKQWRSFRRTAPAYRDELPELTSALKEYAHNIDSIIDAARQHDVHVMLLTQPSLYKEGLEKELADLLWFGGVDNFMAAPGSEYYSVTAMQRGLDAYNNVLLSACDRPGVSCVDLAAQLPKDTTVFYDDVHLNESGARKVADIMGSDLHKVLISLPSKPK